MPTGVLLMTFGSAVTADEVPAYLRSVRGGSDADPELIAEFQRRFHRIGRSPLIDITGEQTTLLQQRLDSLHGKDAYTVAMGMQHSAPSIDDAAAALIAGHCDRIVGVVLAPQYSPLILAGYERALERVRRAHPGTAIAVAGAWHTVGAWIDSLAERTREALADFPAERRDAVPIILTAHSLPRSVVDRDPGYIAQLEDTASTLVARLGLSADRCRFAWQSAGHTPAEWLKPDLSEVLAEVAAAGHPDVLIVPLQFLTDHLEILYDIDVAAREQAIDAGVDFHRIAMPNSSDRLIEALVAVVDRELSGTEAHRS
jgi:ferrochelatase